MGAHRSQRRPNSRSAATRARLLAVAEQLFAAQGVASVTLAQVGEAAGQRNAAACQYHFGNKEGLLQAIVDKHVPGIAARRRELLDDIDEQTVPDLRRVVHAFVQPVAEKVDDPNGGRDFIRITAQLVALHSVANLELGPSPLQLPGGDRLARVLKAALAQQRLPDAVVAQRAMLAAVLLFHGVSDHLRMRELTDGEDTAVDTSSFMQTLEDAVAAVLAGPGPQSATTPAAAGRRRTA